MMKEATTAVRWRFLLAACAALQTACATVEERSPRTVEGARSVVTAADGATVRLRRWSIGDEHPRRVLVVPELGFDARLAAPLCAYLFGRGWDVVLVEGRAEPGPESGWGDWVRDVATIAAAHAPRPRVVAIGVGGAAALPLLREGGGSGLLAINVPLRWEVSNFVAADFLATHRFDPAAWLGAGREEVVLGAGRNTPPAAMRRLAATTRPLPEALRWDVARRFTSGEVETFPHVPASLLVSVKNNFVAPEHALVGVEGSRSVRTRRLALMEYFARDYGHLDWLADERAHGDVFPVIAAELEALR